MNTTPQKKTTTDGFTLIDGYYCWNNFVFTSSIWLGAGVGVLIGGPDEQLRPKGQAVIQQQHGGKMGLVFCDGQTEKPKMKAVFGVEHVAPKSGDVYWLPSSLSNPFPDPWLHRWNRDNQEH